MSPGHHSLSSALVLGCLLSGIVPCIAYIPALPINDTSGLNLTDASTIAIQWTDPLGVYSGDVSFQLEADVRTGGTTSGALVHFSESNMGSNLSTSTPWIAFVSCDVNETDASDEWDIFTLARDRGAVSALLYTTQSTSCVLNSEYVTEFEKPLDVFATKTLQVARLIENQYTHTNSSYEPYNGTLLNDSASDVNASIYGTAPSYKSYLVGTLTARNSTGQATSTTIPNTSSSGSSSGSSSKKTSTSMIVLYAITGIVCTMFLLMLILGARRALRDPGRYGRREHNDEQEGQSAAQGLAQAILDTFPVIKFSRANKRFGGKTGDSGEGSEMTPMSQVERGEGAGHVHRIEESVADGSRPQSGCETEDGVSFHSAFDHVGDAVAPVLTRGNTSSLAPLGGEEAQLVLDSTKEVEELQCPICLVDFEEGDDLRALPCEKEHMYHKGCIDPWLLQVSSSCPLCRKDFNNISSPANTPTTPNFGDLSQPPTQHGFTRYLAFMRRDRQRLGDGTDNRTGSRRERQRTRSGINVGSEIGLGRSREADQGGPGGY